MQIEKQNIQLDWNKQIRNYFPPLFKATFQLNKIFHILT